MTRKPNQNSLLLNSVTRRRHYEVVLGIDPGTAHTGWCVCHVYKTKVKVIRHGTIKTDTSDTMPVRQKKIQNGLRQIVKEHGVEKAICEAFEVRGWQAPRKQATSMSKLVNVVSEAIFECGIPFMLSSPDIKKDEELTQELASLSGSIGRSSEHARDALRHVLCYRRRRLQ